MGRKLSHRNYVAFQVAVNSSVEEAAETYARKVVDGEVLRDFPYGLSYPPNAGLTNDEVAAIEQLRQVPGVESALRKVLAATAAEPIDRLLCIIDGVDDPGDEDWTGVSLLDKRETDEEGEFLHDGFYEAYWEWRKVRPDKGWRLDTYEGPDVTTSLSED